LELAMRTISLAAEGPSGKATMLLPLPDNVEVRPRCPVELPAVLVGKNPCEYRGLYHTDFTIPQEYFIPDVERPRDLPEHRLDFTYLFDGSLDNFDFDRMGQGEIIRESESPTDAMAIELYKYEKRLRGSGTEVDS
jgi:hypothetical protein